MNFTDVVVAGATVAQTFKHRADAQTAAARLRAAGFADVRLSERDGTTSAEHVAPEAGATEIDFAASLERAGLAADVAAAMTRDVAAGAVLLTVIAGPRTAAAISVLRGETVDAVALAPFDVHAPAADVPAPAVPDAVDAPRQRSVAPSAATPAAPVAGDRVIPLRAERLDIATEREQREARVRKETVTEQQVISVPVQREQLVVERDGEAPVRIPLHDR